MSVTTVSSFDSAPGDSRTDEQLVIVRSDEKLPVVENPKRRRVNVFIAHKSRLLTEGLAEMLAKEDDLRVAGTAFEGASITKCLGRNQNCVVIIDSDLASEDSTLLRTIAAAGTGVRIVLLMPRPDDQLVLQALQLGVRGVILESMGARLLMNCIRKVFAGEEWIEQGSAVRLLHRFALQDATEGGTLLSRREIQVIRGIARGLTNRQIASELFINSATVKTHVHNVFRKLEVSNRVSVTNWARTRGLV